MNSVPSEIMCIDQFVAHVRTLEGGAGEFKHMKGVDVDGIPLCLLRWLEVCGGAFTFEFNLTKGLDCYQGGIIIDPRLFAGLQSDCLQAASEDLIAEDDDEKQWWGGSFPFAELKNGDYLALVDHRDADSAVVYLSHEGDSGIIAPTFSFFRSAWPRLCYLGPENWLLRDYMNSATGFLDPDSEEASELRHRFGMCR